MVHTYMLGIGETEAGGEESSGYPGTQRETVS